MIVRRFGSDATHLADVPQGRTYQAARFGSTSKYVMQPVEALCGATLKGTVVAMRETTTVSCKTCHAAEQEQLRLQKREDKIAEYEARLAALDEKVQSLPEPLTDAELEEVESLLAMACAPNSNISEWDALSEWMQAHDEQLIAIARAYGKIRPRPMGGDPG